MKVKAKEWLELINGIINLNHRKRYSNWCLKTLTTVTLFGPFKWIKRLNKYQYKFSPVQCYFIKIIPFCNFKLTSTKSLWPILYVHKKYGLIYQCLLPMTWQSHLQQKCTLFFIIKVQNQHETMASMVQMTRWL